MTRNRRKTAVGALTPTDTTANGLLVAMQVVDGIRGTLTNHHAQQALGAVRDVLLTRLNDLEDDAA